MSLIVGEGSYWRLNPLARRFNNSNLPFEKERPAGNIQQSVQD
ncbi:hypothetical protein N8558_00650 [bacterium]|jgi:hypothetical protein|nr:hypothetical protein [bacterium]MDB4638297.1 hypothetical protein [bacterium]